MGSFPPAEWVEIGTTSGLIVLWASTTSLYSFPLLLATVHPLLYTTYLGRGAAATLRTHGRTAGPLPVP